MRYYYSLIEFIGVGLVFWLIAGIIICLSIVYVMAENYGRSGIGWLVIAIFFSLVTAIVGLDALGKTLDKRLEDWKVLEREKRWILKELDRECE